MRKLLLITVTMVVLSLLCISPVKAACPDTSYVTFKVTIGTGDCLNLEECGHIYVVLYRQGGSIIDRKQWNQYQTLYELCAPGPITSGQFCAVLVIQPGYCTNMTLPPAPDCTGFTNYPIWGSKGPISLTINDYCLEY